MENSKDLEKLKAEILEEVEMKFQMKWFRDPVALQHPLNKSSETECCTEDDAKIALRKTLRETAISKD